jgi:1,4-dihydroxy-2-naphthoate octaprenyltransferase
MRICQTPVTHMLSSRPADDLGPILRPDSDVCGAPSALSLPLGLLTVAILHGNNLRDMADGTRAGFRTTASTLGPRGSAIYYLALLAAAYATTLAAIVLGWLSWLGLLVGLTVPFA